MKPDIREIIKSQRLWFDGGTGSMLQSLGLPPGDPPESMLLSSPDLVASVHRAYIDAGCRIICTNTFGVNSAKYENYRELISAAFACVREAAGGRDDVYIAFDAGPTGRLLEPLGDLPFEEAVSIFKDGMRTAEEEGADLILIETMNDSYETKAAVLAAKEATSLPVFVTNVYDESCRLLTGATPEAMAATLEGLGVDALGVNCSLGPDLMLPVVERLAAVSSLPLIACPNAGMPGLENGVTVYDVSPDDFASSVKKLIEAGVTLPGGCCGTTPAHLAAAIKASEGLPFCPPEKKNISLVSSFSTAVEIGREPVMIGERINPTGKPMIKQALRSGDFGYILSEALSQEEAGARVLDVNVGLPGTDEPAAMKRAVLSVQSVTGLPLQLDSASPAALEAGMRIYNGKPMVNSVDGSEEKMKAVFPLIKKYGGLAVALTMDGDGIPATAEGRVEIALRIAERAAEYGIDRRDLIFDPLTLSVSAEPDAAKVTLDAVSKLQKLGFHTLLGVSNVSFGLPDRDRINAAFLTGALSRGLSAAIVNPFSRPVADAFYSWTMLGGYDPGCAGYIAYAAKNPLAAAVSQSAAQTPLDNAPDAKGLAAAVVAGLKQKAAEEAKALPADASPLDVINGEIIPALNEVGRAFEEKRIFLPQLLACAEAATAAFGVLKTRLPEASQEGGNPVILATVRGDIHDIGKNIVKLMLGSYGFRVIDLGKNVPPETVLEAVRRTGCMLVGLSALMTTTVPSMEETVRLLHESVPGVSVMVGGAVLTREYADMIGADDYAKDAMGAVEIAKRYYREDGE